MDIHQIWLGDPMPPRIESATAAIRAAAEKAGHRYSLWDEFTLSAAFGDEFGYTLITSAKSTMPPARWYALMSDWARWRLLAEYGGLYLDTDTELTTSALPASADLGVADINLHTYKDTMLETGAIYAKGERGKKAAALAANLATLRMTAVGDIGAQLQKTRLPSLIGPYWMWETVFPAWRNKGFSYAAINPAVASCTNLSAALHHWGAWSWNLDKSAPLHDVETHRRNGPIYTPRRIVTKPQATKEPSLFSAPAGAERIVIFSNVTSFDPARVPVRAGDWCIHINRAAHAAAAMSVPNTWHTLFVRHGSNHGTGYTWHTPPAGFNGYQSVVFYFNAPPTAWMQEYRLNAKSSNPTSGFCCFQYARAAAPHLPLILAGFAPDSDISYRWPEHDWQYEANYYKKHNITIIRP